MTEKKEEFPQMKSKKVIRVCRSHKRCEPERAKYIWERICNELGIDDYDQEYIEMGNLRIERTNCQGHCKMSPNIQVKDIQTDEVTQLSRMDPIQAAQLLKKLVGGGSEKNIGKKSKQRE